MMILLLGATGMHKIEQNKFKIKNSNVCTMTTINKIKEILRMNE